MSDGDDIVSNYLGKGYKLVTSKGALSYVIKAMAKSSGGTALDFETTSLEPSEGRVRLVSLCNRGVRALVDFDCIKGGFEGCARMFDLGGKYIVFNTFFESKWFNHYGARPEIIDAWWLRCATLGGGRTSLARWVGFEFDYNMDKSQQVSDWSAAELTQEQLDYAFLDAAFTWELWVRYAEQMDQGQWDAAHLFNALVPPVTEMQETGLLLDIKKHKRLTKRWRREQLTHEQRVRALVPESEVKLINSNAQWSDYFGRVMPDSWLNKWPRTGKSGHLSMQGATLKALAASAPVDSPLRECFEALVEYNHVSKYVSSFGDALTTAATMHSDHRIRARYNIAAAKTCRFSSSAPNVQQVPRGEDVRMSFVSPPGRVIVSLDYSAIELRVLALLTEDDQLLEDVVYGDVHSEVAAVVAGAPIDKTTPEGKAARTAAKGISFGIIYGSGAGGIAYSMHTSIERAQSFIDYWADRYPRAFDLRNQMMEEARKTGRIRVVDGGTIWMTRKPELPKCANYPVQRAALSVMARAIIRHHAALIDLRKDRAYASVRMAATIHDALMDEAPKRCAKTVLNLMERDMTAGYLDVFPGAPTEGLVEGGIGKSWGALQ